MKQRLLKTIALGLMAMVGVNAWADGKTIYPSTEMNGRLSYASTTYSHTISPATITADTYKESTWRKSGFYTLQEWDVTGVDLDRIKSITYTFYTKENTGGLLWIYGSSLPATTITAAGLGENMYTVMGSYPGDISPEAATAMENNAWAKGASRSNVTTDVYKQVLTITGDAITTFKNAVSANKIVFVISASANSSVNIYTFLNESYKAEMKIDYYPVTVTIGGTTTNYAEINSTLNSSLTDDATIKIYDDVNMSNRIQVAAGKTVNVVPQKAGITITNTASNSLSFLANTKDGTLNVGSDTYAMILKNKDASTNAVVESSYNTTDGFSYVNISNVTFKDISTSKQGLIFTNNSRGKVTLKNVTFSDCTSTHATTPSMAFCNGNDDAIVLEGNNQFENCTGYDLYANKRFNVNATNGVTNTTPIKVYTSLALGSVVATTITEDEVSKFIIMNAGYGLYKKDGSGRQDLKCCEGYPLQVTSAGAATLMLPYASTIPTGVTCYTLSYTSGDDITATEVTGGTLSANTPVLVIANEGLYYMLNSTKATTATAFTASDTHSEGVLTGVYQETVVPANNFILTKHGDAVGFRKANGTNNKVKAYRAYMTATHAGAPEFLGINFDGNVTAIDSVEKKAIVEDGEIYNLQGVRMNANNLPKGIYVKNGKKFVVK